MNRICILKGCYKKHSALGFCAKHYYVFVDKQRMETGKKKTVKEIRVYSIDPGEYTQFKVDPVDMTL